ncbi:MAG: CBS domain-containing protein [Deltaproteobacteria bacterium]|nr:CBS domain-containing protein [Deltaproteobacteria bacterium]
MQVAEIMSNQTILTINLDFTLLEAREYMLNHRINHVPVIDDEGKLAGLITQNDVERNISPNVGTLREHGSDRDTLEMKVHRIMNRSPKVVSSDTEIADAANILAAREATCLFVINRERRIIGIVTVVDLLRFLAKLTREAKKVR